MVATTLVSIQANCSSARFLFLNTHTDKLFLNRNSLSGRLPESLADLAALKELNLSNNLITGTIPAEYSSLSALGKKD